MEPLSLESREPITLFTVEVAPLKSVAPFRLTKRVPVPVLVSVALLVLLIVLASLVIAPPLTLFSALPSLVSVAPSSFTRNVVLARPPPSLVGVAPLWLRNVVPGSVLTSNPPVWFHTAPPSLVNVAAFWLLRTAPLWLVSVAPVWLRKLVPQPSLLSCALFWLKRFVLGPEFVNVAPAIFLMNVPNWALVLLSLVSVAPPRSEEHTSELQSLRHLVCR